jgi:hypothetical protein
MAIEPVSNAMALPSVLTLSGRKPEVPLRAKRLAMRMQRKRATREA